MILYNNHLMYPKSIFDVPRKKEDLVSTNQSMSNLYYDEIASLENNTDSGTNYNFGNGPTTYRWHPPAGTWWIPSRSYFRLDCELSRPDGTPLISADNIAVNMGMASCLFSKMQYKINDQTISEISENVAQVDAIRHRLGKTGRWLETTGDNLNMWDPEFIIRQQKVLGTGIDQHELRFKETVEDAGVASGYRPFFFDYATPNQIQLVAATNEVRFTANGGTAIPDLSRYIEVGARVYFTDGVGEQTSVVTGYLSTVTTNDTLVLAAVPNNHGPVNLAFNFRIAKKVIDNEASADRRVKKFSIIYQPPLSIFGIGHAIPGSSKHELVMTPYGNTVYQKNAIESILADKTNKTAAADNDFRFAVSNMLFYAARCDGPIVEKDEFFLDLSEIRAQLATITSSSRTQLAFDISPSTYALTAAFQDQSAGSDTRYSLSKFKIRDSEELKLRNFYIRYGGIQKPQPDFRPLYDEAENTDNLVDQYARSLLYTGSYHDSSTETLKQWRNRGMYMHWPWPKTGTDKETRAYVSTEFANFTDPNIKPRLILFSHFSKVMILKYENGALQSTIVNEV